MLYAWEQGALGEDLLVVAKRTLARRRVADRYRAYLDILLRHLATGLPEVDQVLRRNLSNWKLERLTTIDRNILRIGTVELMFQADVPSAVAIHEAIQLAQRYGTAESAKFVNGVLDAIARALREESPPPNEMDVRSGDNAPEGAT